MEFDWKNTGVYGSVAEVIETAQHIPQLHPLRKIVWARPSALSCSQTQSVRDLPAKRRLLLGL